MKVFEPMKINGLELKNRMVVSAMVTNYCTPDGKATENLLLITNTKQKADGQIESHRKLTERVHAAGGKSQLRFIMPEERQAVP